MEVKTAIDRRAARLTRKQRIRRKVTGTAARPRLVVFRSYVHIYCQVIDDEAGHTMASASSQSKELASELSGLNKTDIAKKVGALIASKCKAAGIESVVFDRNGYIYHGRVSALADAAREAGLQF